MLLDVYLNGNTSHFNPLPHDLPILPLYPLPHDCADRLLYRFPHDCSNRRYRNIGPFIFLPVAYFVAKNAFLQSVNIEQYQHTKIDDVSILRISKNLCRIGLGSNTRSKGHCAVSRRSCLVFLWKITTT